MSILLVAVGTTTSELNMSDSCGLKDACAIEPRTSLLQLLFERDPSLMLLFVRRFSAAVICFKYMECYSKSFRFCPNPHGSNRHLLCIVERKRLIF